MPNRLLKEGIRTSKKINSLSDFEFRTWAYLITYVDDYGRGSADPELLKGFVFPRRKEVREQDIRKALAALERTGSILLYDVAGEPYFCFPNWSEHQRIQTKKSKYPAPADCDMSRWLTVIHGDPPPESESESESKSESNPKEGGGEPLEAASPPVVSIPLNDGTEFPVSQEQCQEWAGVYPAVNVIQQLREMREWCLNNPAKRKTVKGVRSFITRWLSKEQDRGGQYCAQPAQKPKRKSWAELAAEMDAEEGHL